MSEEVLVIKMVLRALINAASSQAHQTNMPSCHHAIKCLSSVERYRVDIMRMRMPSVQSTDMSVESIKYVNALKG